MPQDRRRASGVCTCSSASFKPVTRVRILSPPPHCSSSLVSTRLLSVFDISDELFCAWGATKATFGYEIHPCISPLRGNFTAFRCANLFLTNLSIPAPYKQKRPSLRMTLFCLVEAAGIEPASANTPPKGATCLVSLLSLTFFYPTDRVEKRDSGKVLTAPSQTYFTAIPYI